MENSLALIKGYNHEYFVSRTGSVISFFKNEKNEIKGSIGSNGYKCVTFRSGSIEKKYSIHRLVAEAFVPNPENKPYVNHLDGDKLNNNDWNLEWTTAKENVRHAISTGLNKCFGENHFNANISEFDAKSIISKYDNGKQVSEIASVYKVSEGTIYNILSGRGWKHLHGSVKYERRELGARLTKDHITTIKTLKSTGHKNREIAKELGVSETQIHYVVSGKTFKKEYAETSIS